MGETPVIGVFGTESVSLCLLYSISPRMSRG